MCLLENMIIARDSRLLSLEQGPAAWRATCFLYLTSQSNHFNAISAVKFARFDALIPRMLWLVAKFDEFIIATEIYGLQPLKGRRGSGVQY
jgi:hypothetical protein